MKPLRKWLLMCSSLVTGVTGLVYFWMKRFLVPTDPFAVVGHPLEPWLLKTHILAAPVLVFALGLIAMDHIWKNYRCLVPAGRRSGIAATWVIAPMVATGYLIQVVTAVGWLSALGWAHLGAGVCYLVTLVAHQHVFRRRANAPADLRPSAAAARGGSAAFHVEQSCPPDHSDGNGAGLKGFLSPHPREAPGFTTNESTHDRVHPPRWQRARAAGRLIAARSGPGDRARPRQGGGGGSGRR